MKQASYYKKEHNGIIHCYLCPHNCHLKDNQLGACNARKVIQGELYSLNYGNISSAGIDPIEKKPLYHFRPGRNILSVGSFGCNFICGFCQNYSISQEAPPTRYMEPEELVGLALDALSDNNVGIAFTYNEPSIWYEYVYDTAVKAKAKGLDIVLVSNGYISEEPLQNLLPYVDAMNIDLKSFNNSFYKKECGGSIEHVKRTIEIASSKCHVEITTLLVHGQNDSPDEVEELAKWISSVDNNIPLHLSRYYPAYKYTAPATKVEKILEDKEVAKKHLSFVYVGNVPNTDNNTYCPNCGELLVRRGYYDSTVEISEDKCNKCGKRINMLL